MSVLNRLFRHSPWHYIGAAVLGAVIALLSLLRGGFGLRIVWADALTTAGAVVILCGLLGMAASLGAFDMFGYSISTLGNRRYKDLYEYSQAKQEKRGRAGWTFVPWIAVGAAFLCVGFMIWKL